MIQKIKHNKNLSCAAKSVLGVLETEVNLCKWDLQN